MDLHHKMRKVAEFSNQYIAQVLKPEVKTNSLLNDWFEAFFWFAGRAFYRGRRDELSSQFLNGAKHGILNFLENKKNIERLIKLKEAGFLDDSKSWEGSPIVKEIRSLAIDKENNRRPVNNINDRKLLRGALKFLLELEDSDYNVTKYTNDKINNGNTSELYKEILDIDYYGDKTACFYLRDMICIFELPMRESDYEFIQPIDTWVKQVSERIGLISRDESKRPNNIVKQKINEACIKFKISPIEYNQGAWYIGKKGLLDELFPR